MGNAVQDGSPSRVEASAKCQTPSALLGRTRGFFVNAQSIRSQQMYPYIADAISCNHVTQTQTWLQMVATSRRVIPETPLHFVSYIHWQNVRRFIPVMMSMIGWLGVELRCSHHVSWRLITQGNHVIPISAKGFTAILQLETRSGDITKWKEDPLEASCWIRIGAKNGHTSRGEAGVGSLCHLEMHQILPRHGHKLPRRRHLNSENTGGWNAGKITTGPWMMYLNHSK